MVFGTPLTGLTRERFLFLAKQSCGRHDSRNFSEKVIVKLFANHPLLYIHSGATAYDFMIAPFARRGPGKSPRDYRRQPLSI
jgi:hypothetical protein